MKPIHLFNFLCLVTACETGPVDDTGQRQGSPSAAEKALVASGFTSIELGGMPLFECGEDDSLLTSRSFTAVSSTGQRVSGAVCCGLVFKGCTVRF